jgi:2-hydroxy-3-keto-5-methylthiopentenyl-1-phosphate phosphatase
MIAVTACIAIFFCYQQALILRRIDDLSGQRINDGTIIMTNMNDDLASKILNYRFPGRRLTKEDIDASKREIDELIKSLDRVQTKYQELVKAIGNNTELREYIESRMKEKSKSKI